MELVTVLGIASRSHRASPRTKRWGSALTLTRQDETVVSGSWDRTCQVANNSSVEARDDDAEEGSQEEKGRVRDDDGKVPVAPQCGRRKDSTKQDSAELAEKQTADAGFCCGAQWKVAGHAGFCCGAQ